MERLGLVFYPGIAETSGPFQPHQRFSRASNFSQPNRIANHSILWQGHWKSLKSVTNSATCIRCLSRAAGGGPGPGGNGCGRLHGASSRHFHGQDRDLAVATAKASRAVGPALLRAPVPISFCPSTWSCSCSSSANMTVWRWWKSDLKSKVINVTRPCEVCHFWWQGNLQYQVGDWVSTHLKNMRKRQIGFFFPKWSF